MKAIYKRINKKYGKSKIKEVQNLLKGFDFYHGRIDGIYGKHTAYGVLKYQRMHPPLVADGIIGKNTLKAMFPKVMHKKIIHSSNELIHDLSACHKKFPRETRNQTQLKRFYGNPARREPDARLALMRLPYRMKLSWDSGISVTRIFMHEKVIESYQAFFEDIHKEYDHETIEIMGLNQYGGAFNHRKMRGSNRWSTHAYGIALDLNPAQNQLRWHKPYARFSHKEYNKVMEFAAKHGLYNLGVHHNYDYMHFQAAWRK